MEKFKDCIKKAKHFISFALRGSLLWPIFSNRKKHKTRAMHLVSGRSLTTDKGIVMHAVKVTVLHRMD